MGGDATIRRATDDDLDALHALVERAYRGDAARMGWTHEADLLDGQRTDRAALRAIVGDPAQMVLIAIEAGRLTGCVQVEGKGDGRAYLGLLAVEPTLQAAGLGKRLLAAAEAMAAAELGAHEAEMTVIKQRAALIAYYRRRGYAPTGEERPFPLDDARFGLPRTRELAFVVLRKALPRSPA